MARAPMKTPEDLSELDAVQKSQDEGIVVPIRNADGISPLGFSIRVSGPDSAQGQDARTRLLDDFMNLGTLTPTALQRDEVETRVLARICMEFVSQKPVLLDGKPLENTEEDFFRLLVRFRWIRRQIDQAQGDRARFLPPSVLTSSEKSSDQSEGTGSSSPGSGSGSGVSSGNSAD